MRKQSAEQWPGGSFHLPVSSVTGNVKFTSVNSSFKMSFQITLDKQTEESNPVLQPCRFWGCFGHLHRSHIHMNKNEVKFFSKQ